MYKLKTVVQIKLKTNKICNLTDLGKDLRSFLLSSNKISTAREKNINGVPFFEIGKDFISGAQSPKQLEMAIKANL
ncbi:hypothetical protein N9S90_01455 [Candidatus Pelagibacter sp.]|nr:hypothetical protein [Candidatus Pelagibacter sp.]